MKNLIPYKLKQARKLRGFSMEKLSQLMGGLVSKQAISKYEKGTMHPTPLVFDALSRALELPVGYFVSENIQVGEISFRIDSKVPSRSISQMVAQAEEKITNCLAIENQLAISSSFVNPLCDKPISSVGDIEAAAESLRMNWNLGTTPIYSVYEMLESVGVKLMEFDTGVAHVIGFSTFVDGHIPLIVINLSANITTERKRFTALHELGHLLLNFTSDVPVALKERYCNLFAGAVLCPSEVVCRELGKVRTSLTLNELISLRNRYGISIAALVHRAKDLGIISDVYYNAIYDNHIHQNIMETGWGNYPIMEHTDRFERLLQRVISEKILTEEELSDLLHCKVRKYIDEMTIL